MIISCIVAIANNYAIGIDNDLPWHMPADLKFFKETTMNHYVLMGRKSFESVGRPLPGRTNIVVTSQSNYYHSGIHVVNSITEGILFAQNNQQKELFILGGSRIYFQTKDLWTKLYLTRINVDIPHATAYFPQFDENQWLLKSRESFNADEKNPFDYQFNVYERKRT